MPGVQLDDSDILNLADYAIRSISLNRRNDLTRDDLRSEAILAGLAALRSAEAKSVRPSRRIIRLCMQKAAFRLLNRPVDETLADEQWDIYEASHPVSEKTQPCVAEDFLNTHLPALPKVQKDSLEKWATGYSVSEIAKESGVVYCVAWHRVTAGIAKLKKQKGIK